MKKLLLIVIIVLISVVIGISVINSIRIGKLNVFGISQIKEENEKLDSKIKEATKLASTDYQGKLDELNETSKKLQTEKKNYEDMISISTDTQVQAANQSYEYLIEFLLIRIENHAKAEGVLMKMDVVRSPSGIENVYDLNFTVTGGYAQIEEFITDIEDDSKLGYKIEEFRMTSSSENGNTVQATFTCKDISITGITQNNNTITSTTIENNTEQDTETKDDEE